MGSTPMTKITPPELHTPQTLCISPENPSTHLARTQHHNDTAPHLKHSVFPPRPLQYCTTRPAAIQLLQIAHHPCCVCGSEQLPDPCWRWSSERHQRRTRPVLVWAPTEVGWSNGTFGWAVRLTGRMANARNRWNDEASRKRILGAWWNLSIH
jgi:hypothetical protein